MQVEPFNEEPLMKNTLGRSHMIDCYPSPIAWFDKEGDEIRFVLSQRLKHLHWWSPIRTETNAIANRHDLDAGDFSHAKNVNCLQTIPPSLPPAPPSHRHSRRFLLESPE